MNAKTRMQNSELLFKLRNTTDNVVLLVVTTFSWMGTMSKFLQNTLYPCRMPWTCSGKTGCQATVREVGLVTWTANLPGGLFGTEVDNE